jgi:hypothetical protein
MKGLLALAVLLSLPAQAQPTPGPSESLPQVPLPGGSEVRPATDALAGSAATQIAVIVAASDPVAAEAALSIERELSKAFSADGRLKPVDLEQSMGGRAAPDRSIEANDHFAVAKIAYDNLDFAASIASYMEGLKILLASPVTVRPIDLARIFAFVGSAYLLSGDAARAGASLRRASMMAPDFAPDRDELSPDLIAAFEVARRDVAAGPKGSLTVATNPPGAVVTVGGLRTGAAPATARDLPAGRHHVLVERRGFKPHAALVDVPADSAETFEVTLAELPTAAQTLRATERTLAELALPYPGQGAKDLGTALSARYLLVGSARTETSGTSLSLVAFDLVGGPLGIGRKAFSLKKELLPESPTFASDVKALVGQAAAALVASPETARGQAPLSGRPLYKRWQVWVGAGAGVTVATLLLIGTLRVGPPLAPSLLITGVP